MAAMAAVAAALLIACAPAAAGAGPAWEVTSYSNPTNLVPGSPRGELDKLVVSATGGTYRLRATGTYNGGEQAVTGPIPYNAGAPEVADALNEHGIPATVTEGPVGGGGARTYEITYGGEAFDRDVRLSANGSQLTEGAATVTRVRTGAGAAQVVVVVTNVGGGVADGTLSPITITDSLPAGLRATAIADDGDPYTQEAAVVGEDIGGCSMSPVLRCSFTGQMQPGDSLFITVTAEVAPVAVPGTVYNSVTVQGGGAPDVSASSPLAVSEAPAGFDIAPDSLTAATSTNQAGAHANLTTDFVLATQTAGEVAGLLKDVHFDLPPGLVGNTVGLPRCPAAKAIREKCPNSTIVGIATVGIANSFGKEYYQPFPVYNIEPAPGEPAAFSFTVVNVTPVRLDTSVLSNGDYGVRVTASDLDDLVSPLATSITIWGVPADHNAPGSINLFNGTIGNPNPGISRVPLLTNPSQCTGPLEATLAADSWEKPGVFVSQSTSMGTMTGCDLLPFSASMSMLPDTLEAGAPAGYSLSLEVPQGNDPDALSQPYVKRVTTALPMGTVISPSAAWGLAACSNTQFFGSGPLEQTPAVPGACPRASQVGTVQIFTPALSLPLNGEVYLAEPLCNPCSPEDAQDGRMVRLFLQVVGEGESGIIVKLEGTASINQQTGQITATFDNNPQLPFSKLKLTLGGGARATLANPRVCGPASTNMDLEPWSTSFTSDLSPSSAFAINQNCFGPQFHPSFVAGTTSIQAGQFTPFTLSFGRSDSDQFLTGLQLRMPPGLLGSLAGVPLCKERQAAEGTCGQESLIGHTQVLTGPGADPFLVTGGEVFLTESYKGAPFGLSIVVPAKAGPYTLSGTTGTGSVVVRAAISIDPHTAALTATSDPLPTALDGIPLQLKVVNVTIDRPGFTFNPTNCNKLAITAAITSQENAAAGMSSPFQVTNCAALRFKPQFVVSTSGHTSKANGASLDAKVIYPSGSLGKQVNIAKVKVELPRQLPSRLTTLQKACLAATFDANPANCPAASVIGIARATTPVLPVQLVGPAYFVSHGGAAFPDLVIVLQGDGVRVDLVGNTFISKAGITSSTFAQVPDVPINSFELYLPEGRYSALAASVNLCKSKLMMPTEIVSQDGATIHQSTKISVTGCTKTTRAKKARKARNARRAIHRHAGTRGGR